MKIRAPKNGYDFDAKQKYREDVWRFFKENITVKNPKILFFPSKEGLEIPVALKLGFKQKNLIAVDGNPAVIAASKWRKKYPDIKFYGGILSKVIPRMERDGVVLAGANLDFCNNLSHEFIYELNTFACGDILNESCVVSFTMMNGRESKTINVLADMLVDNLKGNIGDIYDNLGFENKRLSVASVSLVKNLNNIGKCLSFIGENKYLSGKVPMVYGFISICENKYILKKVVDFNKKEVDWKKDYIYKKVKEVKEILFSHPGHPRISLQCEKDRNKVVFLGTIINACVEDIEKEKRLFINPLERQYGISLFIPDRKYWEVEHDCSYTGRKNHYNSCFGRATYKYKRDVISHIKKMGCFSF